MKNVREAALRYLSFRDRTSSELKKYLSEKEFPPEEVGETIEAFLECGLLSDEKYCANYVRFAVEKGRGPLRIEKELRDKGIAVEDIRTELEAYFAEGRESEIALEYAEKMRAGSEELSEKELARIGRRLAAQGFHSSVLFGVIGKLRRKKANL